ncbi:MAG TPA: TonB-dependent receptor [Chryseolinea sp.]|nr:TonB-dependent receptor [Chryseolinea sp.]
MNETLLKFSIPWLSSWEYVRQSWLSITTLVIVGCLSMQAEAIAGSVGRDVIVTGEVTDEVDGPIPGVNVIVRGTTTGTTTDERGHYSINVPDGASVLVFSFIGYKAVEVTVGAQTAVNVKMEPDVSTLSEVVVVGYGVQKRSSVTGAVASVDNKDLTQLPVPSVQSALQGRVAGVSVTNNGSPGATPIVRIRGIGSITGSSDPLYVVDGFPTGGINSFDPKDIESVEVLKDAASAAIYGSRAANGVILITTKKGAKNKGLTVSVDSYYGAQTPWKTLDLLKRDDYLRYGTDLLNNAGATLPGRFTNMDAPLYDGTTQTYAQTETDWQKEVFQTAPIYQIQASVASTSDNVKLYSSAGTFGQDGIMIGTNFKRYNYRLNTEVKLSKHVTFGQTLTIASSNRRNEQESGGRTILQHVIHQVPYIPVHDPTKLGGYRAPDNSDGSDPENPVRILLMDKNQTNELKVFGTAFVNVSILPSLTYKFTLGGDFTYSKNTVDQPIYNDGFGARITHNMQDNRTQIFSPLFQNQLTFEKVIGKHSINVTAVAERQDVERSVLNASAQQATNSVNSMEGGQNQAISDNDTYETTLLSYLARVNYEFEGKYLLSASIRRDGYSGFAPGHKWGNFPGISVGWRLSEEGFMQSVSSISELKLRASYGSLGVNNVGPFDWQALVNVTTIFPFNNQNVSGSYFNSLPNSQLSWEKTNMTNFGVDLGLFENRFTLNAEYFQRKVDDLLLRVPLAPSMGYSVDFLGNVGSMENSGFEFQAGYNKFVGDFTFSLAANIGTVTNKVTNLYVPGNTIYAGSNADFGGYNITKTEVNHAVQGFYGWVTDGIFQSQEEINAADGADGDGTTKYQSQAAPGDIRFKDVDGNGTINESDRTYLGSFMPDFSYGLNFSANYKNFDLTLFLQGVQGNKVYNGTKVLSQGMLRLFGAETDVLNAWRPDNTNTDVPRAVGGDPNQNSRTSNRFIEDGSYMRVKSLSIGYSLPSAFLNSFANASVRRLRIYASFQNLLTFTKYSGYDPEIGARTANSLVQGIDYGQYPQPRTIMGGIQIEF